MSSPLHLPTTRREFLKRGVGGIGLLAFSPFAPSFLVQSTLAGTPAPERNRRILVLVQLAGGNDGLNTLVPYRDDHYYRLRPRLAIPAQDVRPINDQLGFAPAAEGLHALFERGRLGIVQNVGYPNPNRSHFRSTEIWETACGSEETLGTGWIGRYLDHTCAGTPARSAHGDPEAIHGGNETPASFQSEMAHAVFGLPPHQRVGRAGRDTNRLLHGLAELPTPADASATSFLRQTLLDALVTERRVHETLADYRADADYPAETFAQSLRQVAALIAGGFSTRVYFVSLTGFDTHSQQIGRHASLLRTLSAGLTAFQRDLETKKLDQQVLTATFSEFGRRPAENDSGGTDHGTAAPLFLLGSGLKDRLVGAPPSLNLERNKDLTHGVDFRQVYATLLDRWLGGPSEPVLSRTFSPLGFL